MPATVSDVTTNESGLGNLQDLSLGSDISMNDVLTSTPLMADQVVPIPPMQSSPSSPSSSVPSKESIFEAHRSSQVPTSSSPSSSSSSSSSSSCVHSSESIFEAHGSSQVPTSSSPSTNTAEGPCYGEKVVGDNFNKNVKTRFMRIDRQTKTLNYFYAYISQDRFDLTNHPEDLPSIPLKSPLEELLPAQSDMTALEDNFSVLVGRMLCQYMPFFQQHFSGCVPTHIDHPLAKEMSQKSKVVSITLIKCD